MRLNILLLLIFMLTLFTSIVNAEQPYYRQSYEDVNIIESVELKSAYDNGKVVIIDVRSKSEFETVHIKNALSVPYGHAHFTREIATIAKLNPSKKIVVYADGFKCLKPYQAAEDSDDEMIPNVSAYDLGVSTWLKTYPGETILLGEEVIDYQKQVISEEQYSTMLIDFETFKEKSSQDNSFLIDSRDSIQRKHRVSGLEKAVLIPTDKLIKNIVNRGAYKDKQLLIVDQIGRRNKWLAYHLLQNGYENFFFLKGGALSVAQKPSKVASN